MTNQNKSQEDQTAQGLRARRKVRKIKIQIDKYLETFCSFIVRTIKQSFPGNCRDLSRPDQKETAKSN